MNKLTDNMISSLVIAVTAIMTTAVDAVRNHKTFMAVSMNIMMEDNNIYNHINSNQLLSVAPFSWTAILNNKK